MVRIWKASALCDGHPAHHRADWLVKNAQLSLDAAQQQVMDEFPENFFDTRLWRDDAACGGHSAAARAGLLMEHSGLCEADARARVMREYPEEFDEFQECIWNDLVMCDGHKAYDRAKWLMANRGMSCSAARRQVMDEFPGLFQCDLSRWRGDADCHGHSSDARANWLQLNCEVTLEEARARVMWEFPSVFVSCDDASPWSGGVLCDGRTADVRVDELMRTHSLSRTDSRALVRGLFPERFCATHAVSGADHCCWDNSALCDGHTAEARAQWVVEHCGLPLDAARRRVMEEFVFAFRPGGVTEPRLVPYAESDTLVWQDEFDHDGPPDPARWNYDLGASGWGNQELQCYTDSIENAWVSDGVLRIRARREDYNGAHYTSARLTTRGKGDWLFGRIEVRARLPTARGSWPAIWMLPTDWKFGQWPRSGEIDIMEHVGYDAGTVHGTVHTQSFHHKIGTQIGRHLRVDVKEWHTYAVAWLPDRMQFMVDGQEYFQFPKVGDGSSRFWPFSEKFHLVLNVAVGGTWGGYQGIAEDAFHGDGELMEVAWVRVYQTEDQIGDDAGGRGDTDWALE